MVCVSFLVKNVLYLLSSCTVLCVFYADLLWELLCSCLKWNLTVNWSPVHAHDAQKDRRKSKENSAFSCFSLDLSLNTFVVRLLLCKKVCEQSSNIICLLLAMTKENTYILEDRYSLSYASFGFCMKLLLKCSCTWLRYFYMMEKTFLTTKIRRRNTIFFQD